MNDKLRSRADRELEVKRFRALAQETTDPLAYAFSARLFRRWRPSWTRMLTNGKIRKLCGFLTNVKHIAATRAGTSALPAKPRLQTAIDLRGCLFAWVSARRLPPGFDGFRSQDRAALP
jgi:hypothetical protein